MNINFKNIFAVSAAIAAMCSCSNPVQSSDAGEFTLKDSQGREFAARAFVPGDCSKKEELPAVFIYDPQLFNDGVVWERIDSLYRNNCLAPVVVACLIDAYSDTDPDFFKDVFVRKVQEKWNAGLSKENAIFFGLGRTAGEGIVMSMSQGSPFGEYWCYSPMDADISGFGLIPEPASYRICYGAKEEIGRFDYYPALMNSIRKRGGKVHSWIYDGGPEPEWWRAWFLDELEKRFPATKAAD